MKRLLLILLTLLIVCFCGCEAIQDNLNWHDDFFAEGQKAISLAENFCFALSDDDINEAQKYLHPDSPLNGEELSLFLSEFEQTNGVDFSNGVAFLERYDYSFSPYNSISQGSTHKFVLKVVVENKTIKLSFKVIDNEKGFGIDSVGQYNPKK